MAKHYAICENMCLEETYSKSEIDKLISGIVEVTGKIEVKNSSTGIKETILAYPDGFNKNNTCVLATYYKTSENGSKRFFGDINDGIGVNATASDSYILFSLGRYADQYSIPENTYYVGVVLKKIK